MMSHSLYKLCFAVSLCHLLLKGCPGYQLSGINDCKDVYIWTENGSVECKYLLQPSRYDIHVKSKYYCTEYPLTRCCETCALLERFKYRNGKYRQTTESNALKKIVQSTAKPVTEIPTSHPNTIQVTFFKIPLPKGSLTPRDLADETVVSKLFGGRINSTTEVPTYPAANKSTFAEGQGNKTAPNRNLMPVENVKSTAQQPLLKVVLIDRNGFQGGLDVTDSSTDTKEPRDKQSGGENSNTKSAESRVFSRQLLGQLIRKLWNLRSEESSPVLKSLQQAFNLTTTITTTTDSTVVTSAHKSNEIPELEKTQRTIMPILKLQEKLTTTSIPSLNSTKKIENPVVPLTETPRPSIATSPSPPTATPVSSAIFTVSSTSTIQTTSTPTLVTNSKRKPSEIAKTSSGVSNSVLGPKTVFTSTRAPGTQQTTEKQTIQDVSNRVCKDMGIWLGSGSLSCSALERDGRLGLKKNQRFFCSRYPLTSCCETCRKIMSAKAVD